MQDKPQLMLCTEENMDDYRDPNLDESIEIAEIKYTNDPRPRSSIPDSLSQNILTQINEFHELMPKKEITIKQAVTQNLKNKFTIRVYYFVKRFLTKLSVSRRHKLFFKSVHFQIVGDKASGEVEKLGQNKTQSRKKRQTDNIACCNPIAGLLRVMPIIFPQSVPKIIWDLWLCVVLIYFFVMIPLELAFNNSIMYIQSSFITLPFYFFLIVDYLMKMNTVYYEYGQPIVDRSLIFNNYLKKGLIIDGVSLLVLLCGFFNDNFFQNRWLNLSLVVFITQYHYFAQVIRNAEESIHLSKTQSSIMNLGKLLFTILYFLHIFSCLWYYIGSYANQIGWINWLSARGMVEASYEAQYLDAFYFSTVTMISVGYGDIVPLNGLEKICTILFMFTTCVQLSFSVNTVGEILNSISLSVENTTEKIRIINKYMNRKKISFELQYQIREYIKIYWSQQMQQENEEEEKLITSLSENLRKKLIQEANFSIIEKCDLFQQTFTLDTKQKLIKLFKNVLISPEQTITCQLPEFNEPCLCFIDFGSLSICTNINDRADVITFQQGSYFGLEEILTGQPSQLYLQSQSFVKLLVLTRSDFLGTIHENPKDYESYCKLKDELITHQRDSKTKCKSCNCIGHDIQNCPIVHYVIDKERVIKSYQFQTQQERVPGLRNRFRIRNQFNAIFDQWYLQEISNMIKNNEDIPLEKFYSIQLTEEIGKKQVVFQSKDSMMSNERGSLIYVGDQNTSPIYAPSPPKLHEHSIFHPQGKILRRNLQRQSIRIKNQGIKVKFQRIIKKIIKMQSYSKAFSRVNDVEQSSQFNSNIRELVENYFTNSQLKEYLNKTDYEQLYFLRMKCNLVQTKETNLSKPFEVQKEYQIYQIHNNLSQVIKKFESIQEQIKTTKHYFQSETDINGKPTSLNQEQRKYALKESLIKYLSFPNVYFQKYYDTNKPNDSPQSLAGQKKARALFKAYKKRMIMRQNAFALPRGETKALKSSLAVGINVIVPEN